MPPENMPPGARREVPSSLFTQIFALVLATVAVAQLINLALLALLPPDPPQTVPLATLAEAILERNLNKPKSPLSFPQWMKRSANSRKNTNC